MKKILIILILGFVFSNYKFTKTFCKDKRILYKKDFFDNGISNNIVFFVFNSTLNDDLVKIKDIKVKSEFVLDTMADTLFFNNKIKIFKNKNPFVIIEARNKKNIVLQINSDTILIDRYSYTTYRFIYVRKNEYRKEYNLYYTNKIPPAPARILSCGASSVKQ